MCDPTAFLAASAVISAGSAIAGHKAQSDAAEENEEAAERARQIEMRALAIRQIEEGQSTSRQLQGVERRTQQSEGLIRASAAEAGVQGGAVEALLGDLGASAGRARQDLLDSYTVTIDQLQREKGGAKAREAARIASVPEPSIVGTGLQIGGIAANYLTQRKSLNRNRDLAGDD